MLTFVFIYKTFTCASKSGKIISILMMAAKWKEKIRARNCDKKKPFKLKKNIVKVWRPVFSFTSDIPLKFCVKVLS